MAATESGSIRATAIPSTMASGPLTTRTITAEISAALSSTPRVTATTTARRFSRTSAASSSCVLP